jgi:beta-hydroxylase
MAEAELLRGTGKSAFRAWRREKVKMFGRDLLRLLDRLYSRQSLVPDAPFIPNRHFPFIAEFEANWREIRAELEVILRERESIPFFDKISPDQARISHSQKWRTFFLWGLNEEVVGNTARCPKTAALLRKVPGLRSAWFSILGPRYRIKLHRGITRGVLRAHLGLIVPRRWQHCRMVVDEQPVHWREGRCFVFDDSRPHRVSNGTDEERVILLFDFDRPMRWPSSLLNRLMILLIKRTAYYQDAYRNLKRHAQMTEAGRDQAIADAMQRIAD